MPRFSATLDSSAKGITLLTCVVMIIPFITIGQYYTSTSRWEILLAPAAILLALVWCFLWKPAGYSLEQGQLRVYRTAGAFSIPLDTIQDIAPVNMKEQGFGIRTFGSGGFFGYFGRFWYAGLGHISIYATNRSKMLLVTYIAGSKKKYLVISPEETADFLKEYQQLKK